MNSKQLLFISGVLSLESLLGCAEYDRFPQYSGTYTLQSLTYSDSSFMGEQQMTTQLNLTDRMEHFGGKWNHHLRFEFIPLHEGEASGIAAQRLDDLSRIDTGVWPHDWFDGQEIYSESKVYGTGSFCNYQYLYYLFLETVPSVNLLQRVYPGQGDYVGDDSVTHMPLYVSLQYPEEVDFDDTEWYDAVKENSGITLKLTLTRHLKVNLPGWEDGYKDCILPRDPQNRFTESMVAVYHAAIESLCDQEDIRKAGVDLLDDATVSVRFFEKVVSGMPSKDNNKTYKQPTKITTHDRKSPAP